MSTKTKITFSAVLLASSLTLISGAQAADAPTPQITKMNSFLCKDIMRMPSDDRAIALAVLHGYQLGKKGTAEYDSGKLAKISDDFIEYCLDHPSDKALDAFAKFTK